MNEKQSEELRRQRVRQAELVKSEPHKHKLCLVCSSVSRRQASICPVCHAYQWDESPAAISAAVDLAATFVFPATLGYAPSTSRGDKPAGY